MRIVVLSDGLTGSLVSLTIRKQHPGHEFLLINVGEGFGKAPSLPFCESAVPDCHRWLLEPLIARRWSSFYLSMPEGPTLIAGTVSLLAPEQIHAELFDSLGPGQFVSTGKIAEVGASHVVMENGQRIDAELLIDTRARKNSKSLEAGGTEIIARDYSLDQPHGLDVPVLRDATLTPPHFGRFLQYIPLSKNLLRVSYVRPEQEQEPDGTEILPFDSNGIRLVGENRTYVSPRFHAENGLNSSNPEQPLPAYLDGMVVSAFRTSAWDAVARL